MADRADGNPLYIEELVSFIAGRGIDPHDAAAIASLQLPESLHSLVLSRIDTVSEEPRRTLKVASIVGRVFHAPVLPGAYPDLGSLDEVQAQLDVLRTADLVALDREAEMAYLFKHVVTQEVAYESMPFGMRAILHRRVGAWIESTSADAIGTQLDLLAYHFWRGDDQDKKRFYLAAAGEQAQAAYANAAAIDYYERLAPLLPDAERGAILLKLEQVLELVGEWARAETVAREALELAARNGDGAAEGWAHAALAEVARKQGRFPAATSHLDAAAALFETADDAAGLGQVWHVAGTVAAMQGDLELARRRYQESLVVRERLGDRPKIGALYSNLAIVAEYEDDLEEAQRLSEQGYRIRVEAGDRWGIGVSLHNLGVYAIRLGQPDVARARVTEAMQIMLEVGDPWFAATERMLLGNVARDAGDFDAARAYYAASIPTYLAVDDPLAQAEFLEDVGLLASRLDEHARALEMVEAAAVIRATIGVDETPSAHQEFEARLATSRAALTADELAHARAAGRSIGTAGAIGVALELCQPGDASPA